MPYTLAEIWKNIYSGTQSTYCTNYIYTDTCIQSAYLRFVNCKENRLVFDLLVHVPAISLNHSGTYTWNCLIYDDIWEAKETILLIVLILMYWHLKIYAYGRHSETSYFLFIFSFVIYMYVVPTHQILVVLLKSHLFYNPSLPLITLSCMARMKLHVSIYSKIS